MSRDRWAVFSTPANSASSPEFSLCASANSGVPVRCCFRTHAKSRVLKCICVCIRTENNEATSSASALRDFAEKFVKQFINQSFWVLNGSCQRRQRRREWWARLRRAPARAAIYVGPTLLSLVINKSSKSPKSSNFRTDHSQLCQNEI